MSVYKRGRIYWYKFTWQGQLHRASTGLLEREHAEAFEAELKRTLRLRAAGLAPQFLETESPRFQEWAEIVYAARAKEMDRPDELEHLLRVVLRFWGARRETPDTHDPYHDLRLSDPIKDPAWIDRFEAWMEARGVAGSTRNHYRSTMSGMYRVALLPRYRSTTNVPYNPFRDLPRDRTEGRLVTVTVEQLRAWLTHASYHVRLAVAIGALAPKLRLGNILGLRWTHIDPAYQWITVAQHKTARKTQRPLVVPISDELRAILQDARKRQSAISPFVVTYHGRALSSIRAGVANAARAAGLRYGRFDTEGVTFHTLRHAAATWMAEWGLPEKTRQEVMGHADLATTQHYTHLRPIHQRAPHAQLAQIVSIVDVVTKPGQRVKRERPA